MKHDQKYWEHETVMNYDVALALACRIAEMEGLEPRTEEWADRMNEIYEQELQRLHGPEVEAARAETNGRAIRERRTCLDMKLSDLSFRSGVGMPWLLYMERGTVRPDREETREIAKALKIKTSALAAK